MNQITISKEELYKMAEKIQLPLDEEVFEETHAIVEAWVNASNKFAEKMMDPRFSSIYPYYAIKR